MSWAPSALTAFGIIYRALEERSLAAAQRLEDRVEAAVVRLASFPESGRVAREFDDARLREVVIAPYVILYLFEGESVVILAFSYGIASDSPDQVHEPAAEYAITTIA